MISFELPGLPKRFNEGPGASWRSRYAESKRWLKWVGMATMGKRPNKPYPKSIVTLIRVSSVEPDYDGLVHSFKPVVDALKRVGIIEDDSPKHVRRIYLHEKCAPKLGKVRVIIEPVDNFLA